MYRSPAPSQGAAPPRVLSLLVMSDLLLSLEATQLKEAGEGGAAGGAAGGGGGRVVVWRIGQHSEPQVRGVQQGAVGVAWWCGALASTVSCR